MTNLFLVIAIIVMSVIAYFLIRYLAEINAPYYEGLSDNTDEEDKYDND